MGDAVVVGAGAIDKAVWLYLARLRGWAGIGEFGGIDGVMTSFHLSDAAQ